MPAFGALLLCLGLSAGDWPSLVQTPYEKVPTPDIGLRPLLEAADGRKITTKAEWEQRREQIKQAWLSRIGASPSRPEPLAIKVESRQMQADHQRLLVSFSTEGDDRLRAYLLVPLGLKQGERRPAVVVFHPTTKETLNEPVGLGSRQEMALALQLVRRGYVTLSPECYIMKGQGAKAQAEELSRRRPGWTGLGKMTFDASRCIDYLETRPEVDAERIGAIGHSLGAKEVLYALAFEPRYKVGVFNEGGIGLRMSNWTDPWYLTEKMKPHIPDMEHHELLALVAPRPFLVLGGDSADGDASWTFIKAARPVYTLLSARHRIGLHNHKGKHTFPAEARELAYSWLDDWLDWKPVR